MSKRLHSEANNLIRKHYKSHLTSTAGRGCDNALCAFSQQSILFEKAVRGAIRRMQKGAVARAPQREKKRDENTNGERLDFSL
jgi:hypothetical protein